MKVIVLTEGGSGLGFGHIMRCVSLCQAFHELDIKPTLFINGSVDIKGILEKSRYRIFNWRKQKKLTFDLLGDSDIVIIDSYLAGASFYKDVANLAPIPVYFDDNKRISYPRGIVINGAIFAKEMGYPRNKNMKYLLGLSYVPLRKEFWDVGVKKVSRSIRNAVIIFGGEDIRNMTPKIISGLAKEYPQLHKKVIVGKGFKNVSEIKRAKDARTELIFSPQPAMIRRLMRQADVAISAAGQTLYELARLGVPTIAITVAKNQLNHSQHLKRAGLLPYVNWYKEKNLLGKVCGYLNALTYARRQTISRRASAMIDGQGARRVISEIVGYRG